MTNWFVVYLISIVDNIHGSAVGLAVIGGTALFGALTVAPMFLSELHGEERDQARVTVELWRKRALVCFCVGVGLCAVVPTVDNLLRAYVMVEGSKVVTAENAEKATAEIVKRVDKLIEAIAK